MHYLSEDQISSISNKLKEEEINYSHLFEDLLDHVCCDIEICMQHGLDYNEASQKIFKKIGLNGLREIQEATIFYVKFNLIIMKKLMNVLAIIGTGILTSGLIFKINHWPGGSMLFSLSFLILFLGFFPTALLNIKKELNASLFSSKFLIYFIGFLALLSTGAAILFTTMHWPGGRSIVMIHWVIMFIVFFPILFYHVIKLEKNRVLNLSLSIFSFFFLGWMTVNGYNQSTNTNKLIDVGMANYEISYYQTTISSLPLSGINVDAQQLESSFEELTMLIEQYKKEYLNGKEDIFSATIKFNHKPSEKFEVEIHSNKLKSALDNYRKLALDLSENQAPLQQLISDKLSTSKKELWDKEPMNWNRRLLYSRYGKEGIYINLNILLKDIYQVQYEVLRNLPVKEAPEL